MKGTGLSVTGAVTPMRATMDGPPIEIKQLTKFLPLSPKLVRFVPATLPTPAISAILPIANVSAGVPGSPEVAAVPAHFLTEQTQTLHSLSKEDTRHFGLALCEGWCPFHATSHPSCTWVGQP